MSKLIATLVAAFALAVPSTALATGPGPYSQPGYDQAIGNTECADHGSFGYFGDKGVIHDFGTNYPGSDNAPGADGQATGDNNSHLCGNPQND
jgi:hypothetical protein